MKDEFIINNKDYIESLMNSCENNIMDDESKKSFL